MCFLMGLKADTLSLYDALISRATKADAFVR